MSSSAAIQAAHQHQTNVQALFAWRLGVRCEHGLPAPPHYQNHSVVLDAFNASFGEGGDGSFSDHSCTVCGIAVMVVVDFHGRCGKVLVVVG